jgi:Undecaprenyl-phosphate galactose phosphotransferase WbaP
MQGTIKRFGLGLGMAISDGLILLLLIYLSIKIRTGIMPLFISDLPVFNHPFKRYLWLIIIHLGVMAYEGAYTKRLTFWDEVRLLWTSTAVTGIAVLIVLFITKQTEAYSRIIILTWLCLSFIIFPGLRIRIKKTLHKLGWGKERILIVGANENGIRFMKAIQAEPNLGYEIAGFIDSSADLQEVEGIKVFRYKDAIERYIKHADIRTIAIAETSSTVTSVTNTSASKNETSTVTSTINDLINKTHKRLNTIFYIPDIKEIPVMGTEIRHFFREEVFALELKNNLARPLNYILKRTTDYLISLFLLPFIMPLFLLIAIFIKLTSRGPVIFSQERIGKNGKAFRCYKFRTMYVDAEKRLEALLENNPEAKAEWQKYWKLKNDPRVTPLGRFLRKTSLDELPQIFNVLKGEMSLIGPRPVVKEELQRYYRDNAGLYCLVPPGITGLWQVSGRSNTSYDERVSLDCWYVRNWNLWLDIVILFKTVKVVLKKEGAY